jgi:carbonic anhydrase
MRLLHDLFAQNRAWAQAMRDRDENFFNRLAKQQRPEFLWIGCSDSRVPANEIVGLLPGDIFVHRNVANVVVHSDLNCLSVIQFAVEVLGVRHIIVCGHYRCGGVQAALRGERHGLVDNWLGHVRDVAKQHRTRLEELPDGKRLDRLCELNVLEQVVNVCRTTPVTDAWDAGRPLAVHGWIYDVADGLLRDLGLTVDDPADLEDTFERVVTALA